MEKRRRQKDMDRPHILVIDDTEFIRELIQHILSRQPENYLVSCACDGLEGIEQVWELRPNVIILDVDMPEANGYEVTQRLRSAGNMTPIIMLSCNNQAEDQMKGYTSGCNVYLTKPFNISTLCFHVRAQLHTSERFLVQSTRAS